MRYVGKLANSKGKKKCLTWLDKCKGISGRVEGERGGGGGSTHSRWSVTGLNSKDRTVELMSTASDDYLEGVKTSTEDLFNKVKSMWEREDGEEITVTVSDDTGLIVGVH
jgi:hypothetical protein